MYQKNRGIFYSADCQPSFNASASTGTISSVTTCTVGAVSFSVSAQLVLFGNTQNEALSIYGILMGMSLPLILFPSAITNSMAVMLLPEVSGAQADGDNARIVHTLNRSLQICMAMGFLSTALFLFYGAKMGAILKILS